MQEQFSLFRTTPANCVMAQKEACIYSWTEGSVTKLTKIASVTAQPEEDAIHVLS